MEKVIVIVGPTSVGKTKMGVELAKKFNGEVISGDSMQIYRKLDIGTAKVTQGEMDGIAHHLIDIKNPDESYSVKEFQEDVRRQINDIASRNKLPIIVGGTGLYIKGALYDYQFEEAEDHVEKAREKYAHLTNEQLHGLLEKIDPASALAIHPNNRQRVFRAIEIFETTGQTKSESLKKQEHKMLYDAFFVGLTCPRELLYQNINERVDRMVAMGLLEEMAGLPENYKYPGLQSMKAIGYKELFAYFSGNASLEQTVELIKKNSRNYAKRQYTWFNNQVPVTWFDVDFDDFEKTIDAVANRVEAFVEDR